MAIDILSIVYGGEDVNYYSAFFVIFAGAKIQNSLAEAKRGNSKGAMCKLKFA